MRITTKVIESKRKDAKIKGSPVVMWESGFGCRISPTGKVSWLVKKRLGKGGRGSQQVLYTLPASETLSLDEARSVALREVVAIKNGVNPADRDRHERRTQIKAYQSGGLKDAIETYVRRNKRPGRYWEELERTLRRELEADLGTRLVANITKVDIRSLIETKGESHPGAARPLFSALRPFFKWCVDQDLITASPMADLKAPPTRKARDRILTDGEIRLFWSATEGWPLFGPFYRLLLLTAQRREEVAGMRWSELDLEKQTWLIPGSRTKNGEAHLVHLSPQAIALLPAKNGNDFVFSTTGDTSISGFSKAKVRLDQRMGISLAPWRIHDLRRTAASGMAALGFQPHIIERVLNHISGAQGGLVSVYQRYEYPEERKRALCVWGANVQALVSDQPTADNTASFRA